MSTPTTAVVVPSYRRPQLLAACLNGLAAQKHPPDEVVVVYRAEDELIVSSTVEAVRPGARYPSANL